HNTLHSFPTRRSSDLYHKVGSIVINNKLPKIWYGGDYNPEQWTEDIWHEDVRMFKLAGIDVATLNVFAWAKNQPNEDTYNFEDRSEEHTSELQSRFDL